MATRIILLSLLLTLSACGGGSGGGSSQPAPPAPPPLPLDPPGFVLFESGQVRPLAFSPDGRQLYAANTPANRLDILELQGDELNLVDSVRVGLEPVAVAARHDGEVWVVNHLSDSVSIVDVGAQPRVTRTLLVGDEPRDIVFAGVDRELAFITAAYRGQNHPLFDPEHLTEPGLGRADVWVYDANAIDGADLNGGPLAILNLFTDSLRSLVALPDGSRVFAAAFASGNRTTTLDAFSVQGRKPLPRANSELIAAPSTGLIVRQRDDGRWVDEDGVDWSAEVRFNLPDFDVFEIDTTPSVPELRRRVSGVGTNLFNMAVNPRRGELYVSNLEARNEVRFEGPGIRGTTVRGHIADTRISVLTGNALRHVDVNPHVDFSRPERAPVPAAEAEKSLSQITGLAVSPDGETLYAAVLGSNKLAFFNTAALNQDSFTPDAGNHLMLPGGGPSGLALSPDGERLAVYTRFDNAVVLVDTRERRIVGRLALHNPEPEAVVAGRQFLYDASLTSANGVNACASCHLFGDLDTLAWDLGDPDGVMERNPNPYLPGSPVTTFNFHPMKGPMTTQTLRGMAGNGPMHWRGDRPGQNRAVVRGQLETLEEAAFKEFNPAFVGLLGRETELSDEQMQQFTDFAMELTPPPNPVRALDNSLTPAQLAGRDVYFNFRSTGLGGCNDCHALDPSAKQFGTNGLMTFEGGSVDGDFKIPHLRNAYSKVGMFGSASPNSSGAFMGDQVRGFGFLHDGAVDTLDTFFKDDVFSFPFPSAQSRANVIRFVMVMDSDMAPVVGQQVTLRADSDWTLQRLALLEDRALVTPPECVLLAAGVVDGERRELRMTSRDRYVDFRDENASFSGTALRESARAPGQELTFTCYPP